MSDKVYCGDKTALPAGYTDFGSRFRCLRKGVGVGLYVVSRDKMKKTWYRFVPWYIWLFIAVLFVGIVVLIIILIMK